MISDGIVGHDAWVVQALARTCSGQKNRRLGAFSLNFFNRPSEKCAECAYECAQTVCPKRIARRRDKALM
jgi:hypothetical protein